VTQGLGAALQAAVAGDPAARITLGELVEALQARGYGLLLFLFAVPNLTPGPSLPGFSTIFAVPLALVAIQMALGVAHPRLPGFLARLGISRGRAQRVVAAAAPLLARGEKPSGLPHARLRRSCLDLPCSTGQRCWASPKADAFCKLRRIDSPCASFITFRSRPSAAKCAWRWAKSVLNSR